MAKSFSNNPITSPSKRKPKFDAHAEALKFLKHEQDRIENLIIIDSATPKREGGQVTVRFADGSLSKPFFYNEKLNTWMELPF